MSGFRMELFPRSAWPHGSYRFEVAIDDQNVTCSGKLPLGKCVDGPHIECDGDGVSIGESGCALDPKYHAFFGMSFTGFPKVALIDVYLDDAQVAHKRVEPRYVASQPNGAGCEPICCSATASLTMDFAKRK